jgi:hypothetical protein
MEALTPITQLVARRNPEVNVHHMHDPAQDRPVLEGMAYLRLKRQRLGRIFERFLEERLAPGGTVLVVACRRTWPCHTPGRQMSMSGWRSPGLGNSGDASNGGDHLTKGPGRYAVRYRRRNRLSGE